MFAMNCSRILASCTASILSPAIALAAALFTWQQVDVAKKHNRASVAPRLQFTPYAEGKPGRNGIYLLNVGLGPAILTGFSASSGAVEASGFSSDQWPEILQAAGVDSRCFATGWPLEARAIKAGDELPLVRLTAAEGGKTCYLEVLKLVGGAGVQISVEYQSLYGDSFSSAGSSRINSTTIQRLSSSLGL